MKPRIVVLCGGTSEEREVSLGSGRAAWEAFQSAGLKAEMIECRENSLPDGLDPRQDVVFSTLHGRFGEDGGMQALLEQAGILYAGSDRFASELCFSKTATRERAQEAGLRVAPAHRIPRGEGVDWDGLIAQLGGTVAAKPDRQGSSVGLLITGEGAALRAWRQHHWSEDVLVEQFVRGRELTVGWLSGQSLGVVEIRPKSGIYDYQSKYTKGFTEYLAPAPLENEMTSRLRSETQTICERCGCRDFARVDFLLPEDEGPVFLEVNTLPGLKETSLLPKSAACLGFSFEDLLHAMVSPAIKRWTAHWQVTTADQLSLIPPSVH